MIHYWLSLTNRDRAEIVWSAAILGVWFGVVLGWASVAELCGWLAR